MLAMAETKISCLTCFQQPKSIFYNVQRRKNGAMREVLKKHFWFTEVDFQRAVICQPCWEQVDSFHNSYIDVQKLYQERLTTLIFKTEPAVQEDLDDEDEDSCPEGNLLEAFIVKNEQLESLVEEDDDTMLPGEVEIWQLSDDDDLDDYEINHGQAGKEPQRFIQMRSQSRRELKSEQQRQEEDEFIRKHIQYICKQCEQECTNFTEFLKHNADVHGDKTPFLTCCGKKYYHKMRLYYHVQTICNPDIFNCKLCNKRFQYKHGLQHHMKEFHATEEERSFKCSLCPESFALRSLYNTHLQSHDDYEGKRWECEGCERVYDSCKQLKAHTNRFHPKKRRQANFSCALCPKKFHAESWFQQHMKKHEKSSTQV